MENPLQWLSISRDFSEFDSVVVFTWPANDDKPAAFVDSLLELNESRLLAVLPQLLFFYLENTYISENDGLVFRLPRPSSSGILR